MVLHSSRGADIDCARLSSSRHTGSGAGQEHCAKCLLVCCGRLLAWRQAWLTARMEAMRRAEREEEEAFQRHLKSLVPPKLAVDPSGEVVTLAVRLDPPDPDQVTPPTLSQCRVQLHPGDVGSEHAVTLLGWPPFAWVDLVARSCLRPITVTGLPTTACGWSETLGTAAQPCDWWEACAGWRGRGRGR